MSNDKDLIDIIIATCNGEKYIEEQINSILAMDLFEQYVRKIIVCDDKSQDNTLAIISSLVKKEKLIVLTNTEKQRFGPAKNFARGLAEAKAEFTMLSDQDDVWSSDKLASYIEKINTQHTNKGLLIFSDLKVVDSQLNTVSPSFFHYQHFNPNAVNCLKTLSLENIVPGCTMMFNRKIREEALPFPDACRMHDWWLVMIAAVYGEILYIDKSFSLYRQHTNNLVGAKKTTFLQKILNISNLFKSTKNNFNKTIYQLAEFKHLHGNSMLQNDKLWIKRLIDCYYGSHCFKRMYFLSKIRIRKSTFLKTLVAYLFLLIGGK